MWVPPSKLLVETLDGAGVFTPDPRQCPHALDDLTIWRFGCLLGQKRHKKGVNKILCNMQHAICNICTRGTLKPDHRLSSALMRNCLRRSSPKQATNWTPTQPFNYILKHANHCYISVFWIHTIGHCKGISSFYDLPTFIDFTKRKIGGDLPGSRNPWASSCPNAHLQRIPGS